MSRRQDHTNLTTVLLVLLVSVLIHLVLWPIGDRVVRMSWDVRPIPLAGGVMQVAIVPADRDEDEPTDDDEQQEPEPLEPDGKLVNLDRLLEERAPDQTDYVSEFDNRVEKETRAPNVRPRPGEGQSVPGDAPDANEGRHDRNSQDPNPAHALAMFGDRQGDGEQGEGDQSEPLPTGEGAHSLQHNPGQTGGSAAKNGLRGSPDAMRRTFGAHGTLDDLPDVTDGDENLLNSRRWRYASFFNRIRDAVAQHWHPEVVHAARDPDGRIYGLSTRITRLRIRLNPDGSVARIDVDRACGVGYLDEEAIRAVRTAQPFSNPPRQLVDSETGFIDFGFGFIFELHGSPRIFRYQR